MSLGWALLEKLVWRWNTYRASFLENTSGNWTHWTSMKAWDASGRVSLPTGGHHFSSWNSDMLFIFISISAYLVKTQISHNFHFIMTRHEKSKPYCSSWCYSSSAYRGYCRKKKKIKDLYFLADCQILRLCRSQFCKQSNKLMIIN